MFITTNTTHAANEHLFKKLPYDPVKDFEPITLLSKGGQILIVNTSLPVNSVQDLIKLAKAKPGKLSFGYGQFVEPHRGRAVQADDGHVHREHPVSQQPTRGHRT